MLAFERVVAKDGRRRRAEDAPGARTAFWAAATFAFAATLGIAALARAEVAGLDVTAPDVTAPDAVGASLSVQGPLPAGTPVVVRFAGLPAGGHAWIAVAPEAYGDAAYDDWVDIGDRSDGVVAFRGQAPGVYAIRAFSESPERHVIAEITVTIPRRHDAVPNATAIAE